MTSVVSRISSNAAFTFVEMILCFFLLSLFAWSVALLLKCKTRPGFLGSLSLANGVFCFLYIAGFDFLSLCEEFLQLCSWGTRVCKFHFLNNVSFFLFSFPVMFLSDFHTRVALASQNEPGGFALSPCLQGPQAAFLSRLICRQSCPVCFQHRHWVLILEAWLSSFISSRLHVTRWTRRTQ